MLIVLDARWIISEPSGIGVYTRELLRHLPRQAPDIRFSALFQDEVLRERTLSAIGAEKMSNLAALCVPYGVFSPSGQWRLPLELRRQWRADLFHSPNYMLPFAAFPRDRCGSVRAIVTVHDVIPFVLKDHAPRSRKNRLWPLFVTCIRQSLARADAVITVSETSGRDLARTLNLSPMRTARIVPILNGVSDVFSPSVPRSVRSADAARTLLYVGRCDPYKNVELLVHTFARLRDRLPFPVRLRLIGPDDPRYPEARRTVHSLGLEDVVRFDGFVSEQELVRAYRESDVLVHPSRYEGFGLQVAEAMRCGLPVVCTNGGALGEIAGDAALVVGIDDATALADAVERVLTDEALARSLVARGRERAAEWTWARTAERTLEVYRRVLGESRS